MKMYTNCLMKNYQHVSILNFILLKKKGYIYLTEAVLASNENPFRFSSIINGHNNGSFMNLILVTEEFSSPDNELIDISLTTPRFDGYNNGLSPLLQYASQWNERKITILLNNTELI